MTFVIEHVAPGDETFFYSYAPMDYFLTSTVNPTRYSFLLYNYYTPSQYQEVIRALDQHKVKYVVWDTNFEAKVAASFFPGKTYVPDGGFLMESYLESHYKIVKSVDGVRLMERKE